MGIVCLNEMGKRLSRWAHNPKIIGSSPIFCSLLNFITMIYHIECSVGRNLICYVFYYPKDDFSIYFCGFISYNLQRDAEAMVYANQAIELNPNEPNYHLLKANILLATKDFNNAIDVYNKVLTLNDKVGEAYYKRALAKAER